MTSTDVLSQPCAPSPPQTHLSQAVGLLGQPRTSLLALAPSSSPFSTFWNILCYTFHWYLVLCPPRALLSPDFFLLKRCG